MGKTFRNEKHVWDDDPVRFERRKKNKKAKAIRKKSRQSKDKVLDMWMTRDNNDATV